MFLSLQRSQTTLQALEDDFKVPHTSLPCGFSGAAFRCSFAPTTRLVAKEYKVAF